MNRCDFMSWDGDGTTRAVNYFDLSEEKKNVAGTNHRNADVPVPITARSSGPGGRTTESGGDPGHARAEEWRHR